MAGALFRGQTPRDVPVGPSGTPTLHLQVSDLGPRRRHTPKTRVPACRTLRQSDAQISPSAAAAVQEANEADLELVRSTRSATGYKNVVRIRGMRKPFKAEMMVSKKVMSLGFFSTAEEAALCCARQRAAVPAAARCLRL